jgi:hypothetical protein
MAGRLPFSPAMTRVIVRGGAATESSHAGECDEAQDDGGNESSAANPKFARVVGTS